MGAGHKKALHAGVVLSSAQIVNTLCHILLRMYHGLGYRVDMTFHPCQYSFVLYVRSISNAVCKSSPANLPAPRAQVVSFRA